MKMPPGSTAWRERLEIANAFAQRRGRPSIRWRCGHGTRPARLGRDAPGDRPRRKPAAGLTLALMAPEFLRR